MIKLKKRTSVGGRELPAQEVRRRNRKYLHGRDVGGVHHGLGPVGRVGQQTLPLLRQAGELLLLRVEAGVDAVLEVRRSRDLQTLLLLPKHPERPQRHERHQTHTSLIPENTP